MKKGLFITGLLATIATTPAYALDLTPSGVAVSYGQYLEVKSGRKADYDNYRLALTWDWADNLMETNSIQLGGYYELSANAWRSNLSAKDNPSPTGKDKATAFSFSPVFRLSPRDPLWGNAMPFLDFGVGAAYISEEKLEKKKKSPIDMGGHFQFEARIMAGVSFGDWQQYEVRYGWLHYSNAGLHSENESIDFHAVTFGWRW